MDNIKLPALSINGCRIRRHMNYCEQLPQCQNRKNYDTNEPCPVQQYGSGNAAILSLTSLLLDRISCNVEDEAAAQEMTEIIEAIENMIAKVVSICGIGLYDEGTIRKKADG